MVKRVRETEKSPQTPCSDANWHVTEHSVAQLLHWDSGTGLLLTHLLSSLLKGVGTMTEYEYLAESFPGLIKC